MRDTVSNFSTMIEERLNKNLAKELKRRRHIAFDLPEREGIRKKFLDAVDKYEREVRDRMPRVAALACLAFPEALRICAAQGEPVADEKEFFKRLVAGAEWLHLELTKTKGAAL